jgi:hypothetical protein
LITFRLVLDIHAPALRQRAFCADAWLIGMNGQSDLVPPLKFTPPDNQERGKSDAMENPR